MLKTVARAIELMAVLSTTSGGLTLTEIARAMRANKQSVFRLAKTLSAFHFVTAAGGGKLRLGGGLLRLADSARPGVDLRETALPALVKVKELTGETACLHTRFGADQRVCVIQVECDDEVRLTAEVGRPFPITVGAPGKTFLAFMPAADREKLMKKARVKFSKVSDFNRLIDEIEKVRIDGYAIARNELVPKMSSVAAPVFDGTGQIVATITLLGASERLARSKLLEHAKIVCDAAKNVSALLGYSGSRGNAAAEVTASLRPQSERVAGRRASHERRPNLSKRRNAR